jgi:hypothetical protein
VRRHPGQISNHRGFAEPDGAQLDGSHPIYPASLAAALYPHQTQSNRDRGAKADGTPTPNRRTVGMRLSGRKR